MKKLFLDFDCTIVDSVKTYCNVYNKLYTHKDGFEEADYNKVHMKDSVFIDDHADNLLSSSAELKICFCKEYEWNKKWQGQRCFSWREVEELLL